MKSNDAHGVLIRVASRLAGGGYMGKLCRAIDRQHTMSTTVIDRHLDDMHELMREDAMAVRDAADELLRALGSAEGRD